MSPLVCARASTLPIREAISLAEARNPEIHSLREAIEATEAKARRALAPAEPSFSLIYNDTDSFLHLSGAASVVYQISQSIGFPGKAFVSRDAWKEQSQSVRQQLRGKELAVGNAVRTVYYNLDLARKNLGLNLEQKRALERILEIAKRRYQSGAITQIDLISTQSELYSNLNDLADLRANEKARRAELNLLIGNEPTKDIEIEALGDVSPKPVDHDQCLQKMIENRPEIRAAKYAHRAAEKAYSLAAMSLLPDFQLYFGTTYYPVFTATPYAGGTNLLHTYLAGVQLTIPLWGWLNERERINEAAHERANAEANLDLQYLQSKTSLETALEQLKATEFKLRNFREHLLPLSQKTMDIAVESYSTGRINFQTLSNAAASWRSTKSAYYAAVVDYLSSYYAIGQLTGEEMQ